MRLPILIPALLLVACNRHPAPKPMAAPAKPAALAPGAAQPTGITVAGKVLERIDASTYSYLRLDTLGGEQWAAVPKCEAKNGDAVVVSHAMPMDGFESKTLNRKFEHIVFGTLQGPGAPVAAPAALGQPPAAHGQMGDPHAGATAPSAPPVELGPIAVSRATGASAATVAEVFAKKATLKEKQVRVHGNVV